MERLPLLSNSVRCCVETAQKENKYTFIVIKYSKNRVGISFSVKFAEKSAFCAKILIAERRSGGL